MSVSAEDQAAFDIATALYVGLRSVTMIRGFTDILPPLFQDSQVEALQTKGIVLFKDIEMAVRRFEQFVADLSMQLSTDNPRIGQYIGYIANHLEDPNTRDQDKIDFINR